VPNKKFLKKIILFLVRIKPLAKKTVPRFLNLLMKACYMPMWTSYLWNPYSLIKMRMGAAKFKEFGG
jgi:hypothetical protein